MMQKNYKKITLVSIIIIIITNILIHIFNVILKEHKQDNKIFIKKMILIICGYFVLYYYIDPVLDKYFDKNKNLNKNNNFENIFCPMLVRQFYIKILLFILYNYLGINNNNNVIKNIIYETIILSIVLSIYRRMNIVEQNSSHDYICEYLLNLLIIKYLFFNNITIDNHILFASYIFSMAIYNIILKKMLTPTVPKYTIISINKNYS